MRNTTVSEVPGLYTDKFGNVVHASSQHKDMYIVDNPNGKFHTVTTGAESILTMHPIKTVGREKPIHRWRR